MKKKNKIKLQDMHIHVSGGERNKTRLKKTPEACICIDMHAVTWGVQCTKQNEQSISPAMQVGATAILGNCRMLFYLQLCLFKHKCL